MLDLQQRLYEQGEKHLSAYDMINRLKPLKNDGEHEWLYQASNTSLQIVCQDLNKAYKEFFKKSHGFPKFKSRKKSKPNFPTRCDSLYFKGRTANIEKIGKVKYKTDFTLPQGKGFKFSNPRISYNLGKWMLSFGMECENQAPVLSDKSMGIDLGVKEQAVAAFGHDKIVFHNINRSKCMRRLNKKLKHIQRSVSRKYEASKARTGRYEKTANIVKEETKLRKLHQRISNIRKKLHTSYHTRTRLDAALSRGHGGLKCAWYDEEQALVKNDQRAELPRVHPPNAVQV